MDNSNPEEKTPPSSQAGSDPFAPAGADAPLATSPADPEQHIGEVRGNIFDELRTRKVPDDSELWGSCTPLHYDDWEDDGNTVHIAGFMLHEMGREAKFYPSHCVGVEWYSDFPLESQVYPHVCKVARELYGFGQGCWAHAVIGESAVARRRIRAAEMLPIAQQKMPKGKSQFSELQIEPWNQAAIHTAMQYADHAQRELRMGRGLHIRHGETGSGKTTLLVVTALECVARMGMHAVYFFVPDLLKLEAYDKPGTKSALEKAVEAACNTDLLILDDIDAGVKPASQGDPDSSQSRNTLLRIINHRRNESLPIFTSSSTGDEALFAYNLGDRILSRLGDVERMIRLEFAPGAWDWRLSKKRRKDLEQEKQPHQGRIE